MFEFEHSLLQALLPVRPAHPAQPGEHVCELHAEPGGHHRGGAEAGASLFVHQQLIDTFVTVAQGSSIPLLLLRMNRSLSKQAGPDIRPQLRFAHSRWRADD